MDRLARFCSFGLLPFDEFFMTGFYGEQGGRGEAPRTGLPEPFFDKEKVTPTRNAEIRLSGPRNVAPSFLIRP